MSTSVTNSTTLVAWLRESPVIKEKKRKHKQCINSTQWHQHPTIHTHTCFIQYSAFCMPADIRVLCAFNKYYINRSFWHNLQFSWGVSGVTCFQKEKWIFRYSKYNLHSNKLKISKHHVKFLLLLFEYGHLQVKEYIRRGFLVQPTNESN